LGVFSVNNNTFDVFVVAVIGAVGYILAVLKFEAAPLLLGFVLGPLMEENLRRAMLLSRGDASTFIDRPISAGFLAFGAAILLWGAYSSVRSFVKERELA
jgi:TctA family transporter